MSEQEKSALPREENALSKPQQPKNTKKSTILAILRSGKSLNRFEAEKFGDHCLHSTIADLRADGNLIHDEWEWVPTRFAREVHVKRYAYLAASA